MAGCNCAFIAAILLMTAVLRDQENRESGVESTLACFGPGRNVFCVVSVAFNPFSSVMASLN